MIVKDDVLKLKSLQLSQGNKNMELKNKELSANMSTKKCVSIYTTIQKFGDSKTSFDIFCIFNISLN